eukprot:g522.t1
MDPWCGWCEGAEADAEGNPISACVGGGREPAEFCPSGYIHSPIAPGVRSKISSKLSEGHYEFFQALCESDGDPEIAPPHPAVPPVAPPEVLSATPNRGASWGMTWVSIGGAFFSEQSVAYIGDQKCIETVYVSPSILKCLTPPRAAGGKDVPVIVATGHLNSFNSSGNSAVGVFGPSRFRKLKKSARDSDALFTYDVLSVTSVSPPEGPTNGGTKLTLKGVGFGTKDHNPHIRIGTRPCLLSRWVSATEMWCVVPPGSGKDVKVNVQIKSGHTTGPATFSYSLPIVERVQPSFGPTVGGTRVTVFGKNFGPADARAFATLDGVPCAASERVSHELVTCEVTRGIGAQLVVGVVVPTVNIASEDGGLALSQKSSKTGAARFSYNAPSVHHVNPHNGPPTGHVVIAIRGQNLASGTIPGVGSSSVSLGSDGNVTGTIVGEPMLARADELVKKGNLSDALSEYVRRLLLSNSASGRDELGRTKADATAFCEFCSANACDAPHCDRLCDCTEALRTRRKRDVANALSESRAAQNAELRMNMAALVSKMLDAMADKRTDDVATMLEQLRNMTSEEERNVSSLRTETQGALAALGMSGFSKKIGNLRDAVDRDVVRWTHAMEDLVASIKNETAANITAEDAMAEVQEAVNAVSRNLDRLRNAGGVPAGSSGAGASRNEVETIKSQLSQLAVKLADRAAPPGQDAASKAKRVVSGDAAMSRRIRGFASKSSGADSVPHGSPKLSIDEAESLKSSATDDPSVTQQSFIELLEFRMDRSRRGMLSAIELASSIPTNTTTSEGNASVPTSTEAEQRVSDFVAALMDRVRASGVELAVINGSAVVPRSRISAPLWKLVLEKVEQAERNDEANAKIAPASARDWTSAARELYAPAKALNSTMSSVWESIERELHEDGKDGFPGDPYDYRYTQDWRCDDRDFPRGPGVSGCCPNEPPSRGWGACRPYRRERFCPIQTESGVSNYCVRPTRVGPNNNLGSLPSKCFDNHGLRQLASCDPLSNFSIFWSCDALNRAAMCLDDVKSSVCPELRALVDDEKAVLSTMLDARGCSLQGHSLVHLSPSMQTRRAIRLTEAEAAKAAAVAREARAVAAAAEQRRVLAMERLNASIEALEVARAVLDDELPVCNESLVWPSPSGSRYIPPETACGAGCGSATTTEECAASAASDELQASCGLGLYGTADAKVCSHLIKSASYKLCHRETSRCAVVGAGLHDVELSNAIPTPITPRSAWMLTGSESQGWKLSPRLTRKDFRHRVASSYCLADRKGQKKMSLDLCSRDDRQGSAQWELVPAAAEDGGTEIGAYTLKNERTNRCWSVRPSSRCENVTARRDGSYVLALRNAVFDYENFDTALVVEVSNTSQAHIALVDGTKPQESGDDRCPIGYKLFMDGGYCCLPRTNVSGCVDADGIRVDNTQNCCEEGSICALSGSENNGGFDACGNSANSAGRVLTHDPNVRIVGSEVEGRIEVRASERGEWGTVCATESKWNQQTANAACKSLGLGDALKFSGNGNTEGAAERVYDCSGDVSGSLQCVETMSNVDRCTIADLQCARPSMTNMKNVVEIVLTSNSVVVKRFEDGEEMKQQFVKNVEQLLSPGAPQKFWITTRGRSVRIGRGDSIYRGMILAASLSIDPIAVAVKTLQGESGMFRMCVPEQGSNQRRFDSSSDSSQQDDPPRMMMAPLDSQHCKGDAKDAIWTLNYIGIYDTPEVTPGAYRNVDRAIERLEVRARDYTINARKRTQILQKAGRIKSKYNKVIGTERLVDRNRAILERETTRARNEEMHARKMEEEARKTELTSRASFGLVKKNTTDAKCGTGAVDMTPHGPKCVGISIGGVDCLETAIVSDSLLTCILPLGYGTENQVEVFVGGQSSSASSPQLTFAYDGPIIERIYPTHGPVEGRFVVQVFGRNFGGEDYNPEVSIGGAPCEDTMWLSDTQLACRVPNGIGRNHSVRVSIMGQRSPDAGVTFEYDQPVVESVMPSYAVSGDVVMISGSNFGYEGVLPSEILIGDKPCSDISWFRDAVGVALKCKVPEGSGWRLPVKVRVGDLWSAASRARFSYRRARRK